MPRDQKRRDELPTAISLPVWETRVFWPLSFPSGCLSWVQGTPRVGQISNRIRIHEGKLVTSSESSPITLDQFLKITGLVGTGGQAKIAIQEGYVTVNGELETRRRRKLALGDVVVVDQEHRFVVTEEMIRRY